MIISSPRFRSSKHGPVLALTAALLASALAVLALLGLSSTRAEAQPAPTWNQELQRCVEEKRSLLAVFLVDESGSLRQTDPDDRRLPAVRGGLRSLDNFVTNIESQGGDSVDIEVTLVGFAGTAATRVPWSSIDGALRSDGLAAMVDRDAGSETDYVNALVAARDTFAAQTTTLAARNGVEPCKVMFWFTDGKFDIVLRRAPLAADLDEQKEWAPQFDLSTSTDGILERGREVICDASGFSDQGIADQLRDAGVIGITLALTTQIEPADKAFLEAIAENPTDNSCGGLATGGIVVESTDVVDIVCELGTPIDGTTEGPCETAALDPSAERVILGDPGMDRAVVTVSANDNLASLTLKSPSGNDLVATATSRRENYSGADVDFEFAADGSARTTIDFDPSSTDWIGTWRLIISSAENSGALASTQVTYWGDYVPTVELRGGQVLRVGDPGQLQVDVVTSTGTAVDAGSFAMFTVDVSTTAPDIAISPVRREGDVYVADVTTVGAQVGQVPIVATISATTRGGIDLTPVTRSSIFELSPPPGYPEVSTGALTLPPLTGPGRVPFTVTVEGAPETDGCVWFSQLVLDDSARRLGPEFVFETTSPTGADDCQVVPAGQEVELDGEIVVSEAAQGRFRGAVGVVLQARPDLELQPTEIPVEFSLQRPIDEPKRWLLFLLLLGAGLMIPLLVTGLVNQLAARFRTGGKIKHLVIDDIIVGSAGLTTAARQSLAPVYRAGFDPGPDAADRSRRFQIDAFEFAARASLNPFAAPAGQVQVADRAAFSSTPGSRPGRRSARRLDRASASLALPGQWFFALSLPATADDARNARDRGHLVGTLLLVVPLSDDTRGDQLAHDASDKLPMLIDDVIEALPNEPEGEGDDVEGPIRAAADLAPTSPAPDSPSSNPASPQAPSDRAADVEPPPSATDDPTIVLDVPAPTAEPNPWA